METGIDSQKRQISEFTTQHENSKSEESGGVKLKSHPGDSTDARFQLPLVFLRGWLRTITAAEGFTVRCFLADSDVLPRLMSLWSEADESLIMEHEDGSGHL